MNNPNSRGIKATDSLDQEYDESNQDSEGAIGYQSSILYDEAQGFTPNITGLLSRIQLFLRVNVGSPQADINIEIYSGTTEPTGSPLGTGKIESFSSTSFSWQECIFNENILLNASQQYWIVARNPSDDSSNFYTWGYDESAPSYVGGLGLQRQDSGSWSNVNRDWIFRTYMITELLDQEYDESNQDSEGAIGYQSSILYDDAQGFTPNITGSLTRIQLYLRVFTGSPQADIIIEIYSGATEPTGSPLGTGTISSFSSTSFSWQECNFTESIFLNASQQYWIVARNPSDDSSNFYTWGYDESTPSYAGGPGLQRQDSGSWSDENRDWIFRTFMIEDSDYIPELIDVCVILILLLILISFIVILSRSRDKKTFRTNF